MTYCSKCGVELDSSLSQCPLCSLPVPKKLRQKGKASFPVKTTEIESNHAHHYSPRRKLAISAVLVTILFLIPTLILLATANYNQKNLNWALYPLLMLTTSWSYILIMIVFFNRKILAFATYLILTPLVLFLVDKTDATAEWFFTYGIPIIASFYSLLLLSGLIIHRFLKRPLHITATILIAISIFLVLLEMIVNFNVFKIFILRWSLICIAALVPVSIFLISISFLLKRPADLKKIFRF